MSPVSMRTRVMMFAMSVPHLTQDTLGGNGLPMNPVGRRSGASLILGSTVTEQVHRTRPLGTKRLVTQLFPADTRNRPR